MKNSSLSNLKLAEPWTYFPRTQARLNKYLVHNFLRLFRFLPLQNALKLNHFNICVLHNAFHVYSRTPFEYLYSEIFRSNEWMVGGSVWNLLILCDLCLLISRRQHMYEYSYIESQMQHVGAIKTGHEIDMTLSMRKCDKKGK